MNTSVEQAAENAPLKHPSERDNLYLINLVCELSGRLAMWSNKNLHDSFWEARRELEKRATAWKEQQGGLRWVKCSERLPNKFGMYVTIVKIKENGLTYHPVSYNQFDTIRGEWTWQRSCGIDGEITEWLDESAPPNNQQGEIHRLTSIIYGQLYSIWKGCESDTPFEEWQKQFIHNYQI